jgi:hypothetical protein
MGSQDTDGSTTLNVALRPSNIAGPADRDRHGLRRETPVAASLRAPAAYAQLDDVLPRAAFLEQLQREKRRADRTKSPLSIGLVRYAGKAPTDDRIVCELLPSLLDGKRETDIVGRLDENDLAILLLDTDRGGMHGFVRRFASFAAGRAFSIATGTYPDPLFDAVEIGRLDLASFHVRGVE